jgi:hypothetical protein
MNYDVPGLADAAGPPLLAAWNAAIQETFQGLVPSVGSRFFKIDPDQIPNAASTTAVKWFADPAEPVGCLDREYARLLSDWGVRGRHALHNEYAEYRVIQQADPATGRLRNKRVEVTTELREYWLTVAMHDPEKVRSMAAGILGSQPAWEDLYGVANPMALSPADRKVRFSMLVAGNGGDQSLAAQGVPTQPTGPLNTEHALFMTHPINGLDDLLYIVMFGAKPYAQRVGGVLSPATRNQIFRAFNVEQLACRHADPAAAVGAHAQAYAGKSVGFSNPLGMYMATFAKSVFFWQGQEVPDDWVRFSRGQPGMVQRLDFGPPDDHPAFLDDIEVEVAGATQKVSGGYQVVQQLEVGPIVLVGQPTVVAPAEFVVLNTSSAPINCREAQICSSIQALKRDYEAAHSPVRIAPRRMGPQG